MSQPWPVAVAVARARTLTGTTNRGVSAQGVRPDQGRAGGHHADRLGREQRPVADNHRGRAAIGQRQPGGIGLNAAARGRARAVSGAGGPVPEAISMPARGRTGPRAPAWGPVPDAGTRRGTPSN